MYPVLCVHKLSTLHATYKTFGIIRQRIRWRRVIDANTVNNSAARKAKRRTDEVGWDVRTRNWRGTKRSDEKLMCIHICLSIVTNPFTFSGLQELLAKLLEQLNRYDLPALQLAMREGKSDRAQEFKRVQVVKAAELVHLIAFNAGQRSQAALLSVKIVRRLFAHVSKALDENSNAVGSIYSDLLKNCLLEVPTYLAVLQVCFIFALLSCIDTSFILNTINRPNLSYQFHRKKFGFRC